ncbi:hypothetical protein K9V57_002893, partial [Listeria monocytogenes]|nr:hypothetical protein [Listeria monocytogenes]
EESKTYFLTHVKPFLNRARKFDGLQQLIICLSEVYERQEINSDDTCESTIANYVLYRFLEMLDVQFTMCIEDALRDKFENLAVDNQYETYTFNYLEILREPSKIFEYYTEDMSIIVEDDLNKIEKFISNLEPDN